MLLTTDPLRACISINFPHAYRVVFCAHVCRSDETILPTDYKQAGQIVDDELNERLVKALMPGVTLHALMDCCHSGTALDLPYRIKDSGGGKFQWKVGQVEADRRVLQPPSMCSTQTRRSVSGQVSVVRVG